MTGAELARLLHAKRTGKGKWQASCPAHGRDRHPSLSITEGRKWVLLKCWSHDCTAKSICEAIGIRVTDLAYDAPRHPGSLDMKRLEAQRKEELRKEAAYRAKRRRLIDQANFWREEVKRLGKQLAESPESDTIAAKFHWALDRQRKAQEVIRPYFHRAFVGDHDLLQLQYRT